MTMKAVQTGNLLWAGGFADVSKRHMVTIQAVWTPSVHWERAFIAHGTFGIVIGLGEGEVGACGDVWRLGVQAMLPFCASMLCVLQDVAMATVSGTQLPATVCDVLVCFLPLMASPSFESCNCFLHICYLGRGTWMVFYVANWVPCPPCFWIRWA